MSRAAPILLCLALVGVSCTILSPDEPDEAGMVIESGLSFGECLGYCRTVIRISEQRMTLTRSGWGEPGFPDLHYERGVLPDDWQRVRARALWHDFLELDDVYGCPDCADGGAEWIQIERDGESKTVSFEYGASIDDIDPLIDLLRELRQSWLSDIE